MHRTSIPWTEFSWNVLTGCRHDCRDMDGQPYCYARRYLPDIFTVKLKRSVFHEPANMRPSMIFVAPSGDLLGDWVPDEFIEEVFNIMSQCPQHIFQVLTKNPRRYLTIQTKYFKPWIWCGTSVTRQSDTGRAHMLETLRYAETKFISFEPILEDIKYIPDKNIAWAIFGALTTGNSNNPVDAPSARNWAFPLFEMFRLRRTPVFVKPNMHWPTTVMNYPKYYHDWRTNHGKDASIEQQEMF